MAPGEAGPPARPPLPRTAAAAIAPPEPDSSFPVWAPSPCCWPATPSAGCLAGVPQGLLPGARLPAGLLGAGLCSGPPGLLLRFISGGRPHSFFHSVVFRAFSPRSPCFRLGKVRETLSSVVTSEPFGLNSKCGIQRPWGAGGSPCRNSGGLGNSLGCSLGASALGRRGWICWPKRQNYLPLGQGWHMVAILWRTCH